MSVFTHIDRIFGYDYGKEEWYFSAREGIKGPYPTREDAAWALITFVHQCVKQGLTGGRDRRGGNFLAEVVIEAPCWIEG